VPYVNGLGVLGLLTAASVARIFRLLAASLILWRCHCRVPSCGGCVLQQQSSKPEIPKSGTVMLVLDRSGLRKAAARACQALAGRDDAPSGGATVDC